MDGWIHPPDWIITTEVFQWKLAAVWWESLAGFIRLWHFECASLHLHVSLWWSFLSSSFCLAVNRHRWEYANVLITRLLSNLICHFISVFFKAFEQHVEWQTRLEWIVTTKRGSNLCYQTVLGPASNNVGRFWFIECELNDILEIVLTFFWKILITKPQTVQLF